MKPIKFSHFGDAHLGKRQYGLRAREEDMFKAFAYCVESAIKNKSKVVILPGDILDGIEQRGQAIEFLQNQVERLKGHGIEVVGIDGNHDYTGGKWLRICGITDLGTSAVFDFGGLRICGLRAALPTQFCEDLDGMALDMSAADQRAHIFVLHQSVAELSEFNTEVTAEWCSRPLELMGVKYVAMGDIHAYGEYKSPNGIQFVYPGSMEVTAANESFKKYLVHGEFDGENITFERELIPTRPITVFNVMTEEDYTDLHKIIDEHPDNLFLLEVNPALPDGMKRVQKLIRQKEAVARAATYVSVGEKIAAKEKHIQSLDMTSLWQRDRSINTVEDAIYKHHEAGTEPAELILAMLRHPEQVSSIINTFLKNKGINYAV